MAATQQSIVVTRPDAQNQPGLVRIAAGPETMDINLVDRLKDIHNGVRGPEFLIFQIYVKMFLANQNPNSLTFAQFKTWVEAQTFLWGA